MTEPDRSPSDPCPPAGVDGSTSPLADVPHRSRNPAGKSARLTRIVSNQWSGPLPPPQVLRAYDDLCPGSAQKIIDRMLDQGSHRMRLERVKVAAQVRDMRSARRERRLGQKLAAFVTTVAIVGGVTAAGLGHGGAGAFIGAGGVVVLARRTDGRRPGVKAKVAAAPGPSAPKLNASDGADAT